MLVNVVELVVLVPTLYANSWMYIRVLSAWSGRVAVDDEASNAALFLTLPALIHRWSNVAEPSLTLTLLSPSVFSLRFFIFLFGMS